MNRSPVNVGYGPAGTGFAEPAVAQVRSTPQGQRTVTPPNAADQRKRMGDTLKEIKRSVDATRKLLESGNVKVEVTNLSEIRVDGSDEP